MERGADCSTVEDLGISCILKLSTVLREEVEKEQRVGPRRGNLRDVMTEKVLRLQHSFLS